MKKINANILAAIIGVVLLILWIIKICNNVNSWDSYIGVIVSIILIYLSLVNNKKSD